MYAVRLKYLWHSGQKTMGVLIVLLYALLITMPSVARQYKASLRKNNKLWQLSVDNWSTDDGLPSNTLLGITQTADGFLWLASYDGLIRFDGMDFKTYGKRNSALFHTNVAFDIVSSKDSTLWIGTHGSGLLAYKNEKITQHGPSEVFIQTILPDDEQQLVWVGTRTKGLRRYHWETDTWDSLQCPFSPKPIILDIAKDQHGVIWIATVSKGVLSYKDGIWQQFKIDVPTGVTQARCLFFDKKNQLWVGSGNGLFLFKNGKFIAQPIFSNHLVHHLSQDASGLFWVGTLQGLVRWNPQTNEMEWLHNSNGQQIIDVYGVYQDVEGSIWIASYRQGLFRIKDSNFNNYNYSSEGVFLHPITSIIPYNNNTYLVGDSQGELFELRSGELYPIYTKNKLPSSKIYQMIRDSEGDIWIATFNGILHLQSDGTEVFYKAGSIIDNMLHAKSLCEDQDGNILIGTFDDGLLKITKEGRLLAQYSAALGNFPSNYIMSVEQQANGKLSIGTNDLGVVVLDSKSGEYQHYTRKEGLASNLIFNTHTDSKGDIWVATNGGISWIKPSGKIQNYTYKDGLPHDNPFDFVEDPMGYAWLPTSRGIIRVDIQELKAYALGDLNAINWRFFDKKDGISHDQCTGATFAYMDSLHNIWFPSISGLTQVNPHQMAYNAFKPPVYIDGLVVDDKPINTQGQDISLPPESQHYTFNYTALSLWAPSKVRFKYRMEGYDRVWVEAGNDRTATYTNLPSGWHTFHVIAANNDGVWNKEGARLRFYVEAYFYETPIFYFIATIAILYVFRAFYKLRMLSIQKQNNLLEQKVEQRTTEIEQQRKEIEVKNLEIARQNQALEDSKHRLLRLNSMLKKSNSNLESEVDIRTLALNEAMDKLSASNKELDNFVYKAPHDFRGPIARILGILQIAKMESDSNKTPYIDKLFEVAQSMDAMLNKLLKVHDIIEMPALHYQLVEVEEVYEKAVYKLQHRFLLPNYNLSFKAEGDAILYTDSIMLEVILESLLENALLYTKGREPKEREIRVTFINDEVSNCILNVWDNGIGIAPMYNQQLFNAFFKASERSQGNGLGLYLVKKATEKLHAKVEIDSKLNEYTQVSIIFPQVQIPKN